MDSGEPVKRLLNIWPGRLEPVPHALADEVALENDWLELTGPWIDPDRRPVDLPAELYLRGLRELDLADATAIFDFTKRYGVLAHSDWHALGSIARAALIGHATTPWVRAPSLERLASVVRAELRRRTAAAFSVDALEKRRFLHLDEIRIHAVALRNMVRLRQILQGLLSVEAAADEWEPLPPFVIWPPPLPDETMPNPSAGQQLDLVASELVQSLNRGLAEFSPRVVYAYGGLTDDLLYANPRSNQYRYQPPPASTYGVLCLQLANHIAENAPYRKCDVCHRWFVRKEDPRYNKGAKRMRAGVSYCTDRCANLDHKRNQLERERRKGAADQGRESPNG